MKKIILTAASLLWISSAAVAQKIGYVDSEYILNQIPEYKAAKQELDKASADWQKEIEGKYAEIDKLYKTYQAEQILLTDDLRQKRENEIVNKEKEAKDLQKQHFGTEGDLFKKRMELVKPIQDKVYNAIKTVSEKTGIAIMFDKSSDMTMLYANQKYDKSDDILTFLGVSKTKNSSSNKK
ncbi:MAG: OmpH family outer membrane protein [Bacteroidetes bacterium]|nr:OmpH family outer membrane protein [Bacteroidota bacterium]